MKADNKIVFCGVGSDSWQRVCKMQNDDELDGNDEDDDDIQAFLFTFHVFFFLQ